MNPNRVVSRDEWLTARRAFLAKEKELTHARDRLSRERRELPWVRVDKEYVFDGPAGKETLSDLFAGRSQLLVYHFMFGPDWKEGCPSCSFWADNYNGIVVHLQHRDVTLVAVSRAPLEKLEAYKRRLGWSFKWVSSLGSDFNRDYHVSFTPEEQKAAYYNYEVQAFGVARLRASACSPRTMPAPSITPTPAIRAASTRSTAPISSSISFRRAATRRASRIRWHGCAATTDTRTDRRSDLFAGLV